MLSPKEQMAKIIQEQPDDSSYDEVRSSSLRSRYGGVGNYREWIIM